MSQPYVGEIRIVGFNFAPENWALCNGQLLAISEYDVLFNLIGTTYGGDGQTNFALPNLQSRFPIHFGNGFVIGQSGGVETVTLNMNQIPVHSHPAQINSSGGALNKPGGNYWANWTGSQYSDQGTTSAMNAGVIGSIGGGLPHENRKPYLAVNFIISLFGVYPSQS